MVCFFGKGNGKLIFYFFVKFFVVFWKKNIVFYLVFEQQISVNLLNRT